MPPIQWTDAPTTRRESRRAAVPKLPEVTNLAESVRRVPKATQLSRWETQSWSLGVDYAAKLGFPMAGGEISGAERIFLQEFSRSKDVDAGGGLKVRYGVAVRLLVRVSEMRTAMSLTLPIIAANAELGAARAESRLLVVGYNGQGLAKLIPKPKQFNVENYVELVDSVGRIQELIASDVANVAPEPLEVPESVVGPGSDYDKAVAIAWALSSLAEGRNCEWARRELPAATEEMRNLVEHVYAEFTDNGARGEAPPAAARAKARARLGKLRLRG